MKTILALVGLAALTLLFILRHRDAGKPAAKATQKSKAANRVQARQKAAAKTPPRARRTNAPEGQHSTQPGTIPFRATVIVCRSNACDAAKALQAKPYLVSERSTPELPLPGCDAASCGCKYQHRDDRRTEDSDRRFHTRLADSVYAAQGGDERRDRKRGRRTSD